MAKDAGAAKSKSAGKMKVTAGPSGKMQQFKGVGAQKAGVTSVSSSGGGGNYAKGGPSGKMANFTGTTPQKAGRTGQR